MKTTALLIILIASLQELPYKPKDEFELKLDFQFKQRPAGSKNVIHFAESREEEDRRTSAAILPYLTLQLKLTKIDGEARVRVTNNLDQRVISKKISDETVVAIDLGFTDDIKDRITAHEYIITFVSSEKKNLNRIKVFVEEDGTYLVNDEKRGKL
jgi:hypothetical protein